MGVKPRPWLIEDTAITKREQDRFDHESVAQELSEVVLAAEHPLAIGLLGPFGSGKSSVVRLLTEHLRVNPAWAVLQVSAEHHSGTARARAMLYGLIDAAHRQGLLTDEIRKSERACLEGARQRTVQRSTRDAGEPGKPEFERYAVAMGAGAAWIAAMFTMVWLLGVLAVFVGHRAGVGHSVDPWAWFAARGAAPVSTVIFSAAVVAGVIGAAKEGAQQVLRGYDITVTSPRPDSTDDLEQVFSRLIDHSKKRLVVAIDDIDRLTATEVLEALTTIRSLLLAGTHCKRKPVFVISCDEDVIREAIMGVRPGLARRAPDDLLATHDAQETRGDALTVPSESRDDELTGAQRKATEEAAQEYLNKLFTVRLTLPAHLDHDLRVYAEHLLLNPSPHPVVDRLGDRGRVQDVIEILVHPQVRDPRHAIRLLNAFLNDYHLASRREIPSASRPPRIAPGEVTGYPLELARLVVLRHDYRELYDRIAAEHDLLPLLDEGLLGSSSALDNPLLKNYLAPGGERRRMDTARWPGLSYLRATAARTRGRRPPQLGALFTLGSTPASRQLGSETATAIRTELIQRDSDALIEHLTDHTQRERVLRAVKDSISEVRRGLDLDNALAAAMLAVGQLPDLAAHLVAPIDDTGRALLALTDQIARRRSDMTTPLASHHLVPLLAITEPSHHPELLDGLTQRPAEEPEQRAWAVALLSLPSGSGEALALAPSIASYFGDLVRSGTEDDLKSWLASENHHDAWPPEAYGALLGMSARHGDTAAMSQASALTLQDDHQHNWQRPILEGLAVNWDNAPLEIARARVALLSHPRFPNDGWGPALGDADQAGTTLAGQLAQNIAQFLTDDDEVESSVEASNLLKLWLPHVGAEPSAEADRSVSSVIAEAVAQSAITAPELMAVAERILADLPHADAADCVTSIAGELAGDTVPAQVVNATYSALLAFLQRCDGIDSGAMATAAQACLNALLTSVDKETPTGSVSRMGLPAVLATNRGMVTRQSIVTRLVQALPTPLAGNAPAPGLAGELLGSLHTIFRDEEARAEHLPGVLNQLQSSINQGYAVIPADFAARYADQSAVNGPWLNHIAGQWNSLTIDARDQTMRGSTRPEARDVLGSRFLEHLLVGSDESWEWAPNLWPIAAPEIQANLLAEARGRCPALAEQAAQADAGVLTSALLRAGDDLDALLKLIEGNPLSSEAITDYLENTIAGDGWEEEQITAAIRASSDQSALWEICLEAAATDRQAARRGAVILSALAGRDPDSAPIDLVDKLAPVLLVSDSETVEVLGSSIAPLPKKTKQELSKRMCPTGSSSEQRRHRTIFRRASGLS
ncbi:P-loop NTPase fold protein [Streptomyces polygonati]|uniref:P-loop NTPase fold protein n=1 Tax=Streptomyces polygonati TaxID=1617087 RepID=A0ABV8HXN6_9ACTN